MQETEFDQPSQPTREVVYRGSGNDPYFGLLLAAAISIGLTPLIAEGASDMRYTITWGMLALFGIMAWLLGNSPRIGQEKPENLAWGVAFGIILAVPLLAFGGSTLNEAVDLIFRDLQVGTMLAYILFVMPLAETLFFRAILQEARPFWAVAIVATIWGVVLFFPLINRGPYPLIVGIALLMMNSIYGYVRERNGLAAAWICQITVNLVLLFIPFASLA